jgi:hypothetical protein
MARHPDVTPGKMFGMPCVKRADGKVVAGLWKDGGIMVKLVDKAARVQTLALPGAKIGSHAFDPGRRCANGFTSPRLKPVSGWAWSSALSARTRALAVEIMTLPD